MNNPKIYWGIASLRGGQVHRSRGIRTRWFIKEQHCGERCRWDETRRSQMSDANEVRVRMHILADSVACHVATLKDRSKITFQFVSYVKMLGKCLAISE